MSTNCECYKKLWLAAVVVATEAKTLAATMAAVATILGAIQFNSIQFNSIHPMHQQMAGMMVWRYRSYASLTEA